MPLIGYFISQEFEPTKKLMNIHVDSARHLRCPSNPLGFPALSCIESGYRDIVCVLSPICVVRTVVISFSSVWRKPFRFPSHSFFRSVFYFAVTSVYLFCFLKYNRTFRITVFILFRVITSFSAIYRWVCVSVLCDLCSAELWLCDWLCVCVCVC